ncbi:MAG: archease [Desulfomonilaceae bacterium]|nr:archease [Desulfomonilaceae bacterium]
MKDLKKADRGWRLLEHTADIRLEIEGETLEGLFINAAKGFAQLVSEPRESLPTEEATVNLEAETVNDLLVDWLRELQFLNQTEGFVFLDAQDVEISGASFKARVLGRRLDSEELPPFDIKAVTYHDMSIERTKQGYVTRIVFDI